MSPLATLPARRYRLLDRVSKLVALVLVTAAIAPGALHGLPKLLCGGVGVVLGVITVFIEPVEDDAEDASN